MFKITPALKAPKKFRSYKWVGPGPPKTPPGGGGRPVFGHIMASNDQISYAKGTKIILGPLKGQIPVLNLPLVTPTGGGAICPMYKMQCEYDSQRTMYRRHSL